MNQRKRNKEEDRSKRLPRSCTSQFILPNVCIFSKKTSNYKKDQKFSSLYYNVQLSVLIKL